MNFDNPLECLEYYAGYHLSRLESELHQKVPDRVILLDSFWEILDSVGLMLMRFAPLDRHGDTCNCLEFMQDRMKYILNLEAVVRLIIAKEVIIDDSTKCWLTQMRDRYSLLRHLVRRMGSGELYQ